MNPNYHIYIAHAVANENGSANGGSLGNQTGDIMHAHGELRFSIMPRYWKYVLRAKKPKKADLIALDAELAVRNSKIGYSQDQRYTLLEEVKDKKYDCQKAKNNCACDCSSLVGVCLNFAGIPVTKYLTTSNMLQYLYETGNFYMINAPELRDDQYEVGDILLSPGNHTAIVVNTLHHMGYNNSRRSYNKEDTKAIQTRLNELLTRDKPLEVDGEFGPLTEARVRSFQDDKEIECDGIVGPMTAVALGFLWR